MIRKGTSLLSETKERLLLPTQVKYENANHWKAKLTVSWRL